MNETEITKELHKLVNGEVTSIKLGDTTLGTLQKLNVKLDTSTLDTNGWQMDFWIDGTFEDKDISVAGSGWYGGTEVTLKEEDD